MACKVPLLICSGNHVNAFFQTSVAAVSVIRLIVVVEVNHTRDLTFKVADLVLWRYVVPPDSTSQPMSNMDTVLSNHGLDLYVLAYRA